MVFVIGAVQRRRGAKPAVPLPLLHCTCSCPTRPAKPAAVAAAAECTDWPWAAVDDSIESARRLFYVAGTRAKDDLYFTYPRFRLDWDAK